MPDEVLQIRTRGDQDDVGAGNPGLLGKSGKPIGKDRNGTGVGAGWVENHGRQPSAPRPSGDVRVGTPCSASRRRRSARARRFLASRVASGSMLQLLDLAGIYFRAFFAVPTSMTSPDGRPVNAVRGSLDILAKVISDARPTRVIACLDLDWRPAWRVELIPSYKTHRVLEPQIPLATVGVEPARTPHSGTPGSSTDVEVVPDELSPQVPILLDVLAAIGIATAGAIGFEADDVIGTIAATERSDPIEVVTGDRDLFQVARDTDPKVAVRYIGAGMSKAQVYDAAAIATRYGIRPGAYADFAALRGDPSDGRDADQPVRLDRGSDRSDGRPVDRIDRRDARKADRRP